MKLTIIVAAFLIASTSAAGQQPSAGESPTTGRIVIHVTGLGSSKAPLRIAVFNTEQTWLRDGSALYRTILDPDGPQGEWTIERAAYGEYAVAAFHDTNGNGELDRNFFGMPKEPYGFSNDARGVFGPASWQDARVRVNAPVTDITIELK